MPETDYKLVPEAKEAIRGYLVSLVALPAAVLTVAMFFLGFLIRDLASGKAEVQANVRIQPAIESAIGARFAAERAREEAEKMTVDIKKRLAEISDVQEKVKLAQKIAESAGDTEKIVLAVAASLSEQAKFKEAVAASLTGKYVEIDKYYYIQSKVSDLNLDVLYASKAVGAPVGQAVPNPIQAWRIRGVPQ